MTLQEAIKAAQAADRAYDEALRQAGYKTRWCKHELTPALKAAYDAKVAADEAMGKAFGDSRLSTDSAGDLLLPNYPINDQHVAERAIHAGWKR